MSNFNRTIVFSCLLMITMIVTSGCANRNNIYVVTDEVSESTESAVSDSSWLTITCQKNMILNKYNIQVELDDEKLCEIEHGKTVEFSEPRELGEHTLCISTQDYTPYNYVKIPITFTDSKNIEISVKCETNKLIVTDNNGAEYTSDDFIEERDKNVLEHNDYYQMIGATEIRFAEFIYKYCCCLVSIYENGSAIMPNESDEGMMNALGISLQYYYDNDGQVDPKINEMFSILYTPELKERITDLANCVDVVLELSYDYHYEKSSIKCVRDFSQEEYFRHRLKSIGLCDVRNYCISEDNTIKMKIGTKASVLYEVLPKTIQADDLDLIVEDHEIIDASFWIESFPDRILQIDINGKKPGTTTLYVKAKYGSVTSGVITVTVE